MKEDRRKYSFLLAVGGSVELFNQELALVEFWLHQSFNNNKRFY